MFTVPSSRQTHRWEIKVQQNKLNRNRNRYDDTVTVIDCGDTEDRLFKNYTEGLKGFYREHSIQCNTGFL